MSKKFAKFLPHTDSYDVNEFPYYWVSQVHARYVLNVDNVLKKYGLDNSRRSILIALSSKPKASISDLSEMIISKMSTTTKIVYRLKDEGLVTTFSCPQDARITRVELTEKGKEMISKIHDMTSAVLEQSFEGLTPLQIEKMMENLQIIYKNLSH